ncbi:hypothetical protein HUK49_07670 [Limosilactobacillus sp. c11Ua_112_M]|uniref:hypothetical protein n=1 Tax=Limosilactobacillus TaxID=2742598 RepID=UPI00177FE034|nr:MULTISPECIES: hypothetical protein [Limosilactobacillus]MBD8087806.1 hypothetical protein [Limosilactobacillus portuensis]MEC4742334.1 hypothetical protein [Limosilactobacillus sp. c10Ua_36]
MKKRTIRMRAGYAILISLILLALSTGVVVFEFQYQKNQLAVNRELMLKLQDQIRENLNGTADYAKEKVHNFKNK